MKLFVSAAAAALLVAAASSAQAADVYFQANAGVVLAGETEVSVEGLPGHVTGDAEFGGLVSAIVGTKVHEAVAVEGELIYEKSNIDGAAVFPDPKIETIALMGNVKYAFPAVGEYVPYVGAGAGFGQVKYRIAGESDDDNGLTWQLKAGVEVARDAYTFDVGYRYLRAPNYESDGLKAESGLHAVTIGVKF